MSLALGKVDKYLSDKGFGFIKPVFMHDKRVESIFFHISTIKNKSLVNKLKSDDYDNSYYFWFDFIKGKKGFEVTTTIRESDIIEQINDLEIFTSKLESYWLDISNSTPKWLELASATFDLDIEHLNSQRNIKQRESENLKIIEEQNRLSMLRTVPKELHEVTKKECEDLRDELRSFKKQLEQIKRERDSAVVKWERAIANPALFEFELLVNEVENLEVRLTKSHEVSNYIVKNRLGDKYQNLAGKLEMENSSSQWVFDGGIDPKHYKELCRRLGLSNKYTDSRVKSFVSYKNING
ncbi:cold shock domain-containing protein [Marinobacterium aestuarii]|uniref:cold shock domain-containing protein n=1 Tax=Marinobacterium aestuarii TaxID=1821621 RepID=UPI000B2406EC|nr:cold shock domain-containing protein [Marinobacterium aestuarii]